MAVAVGELRRKREAMDMLVTEIAKGEEDHVPIAIRTAIERGWLSSFMDSLTDAKKKKEAEIDRICSRHYGDFLQSVHEMLETRGSATHLSRLVNVVHTNLNTIGGDLVTVLKELSKIQIERENANSLLETTIHCKDIAALMLKTRQQIESDDHYSAMRTIEIIKIEMVESTAKPLVKVLESWLPMTINKLLYGARSEADTVITKIRSNMDLIGQTVMIRQARTAIHLPMDYIISNNSTNNYNSNSNSIGGCISLERLNSFGQIFRLDKWGKQKDFQGIIPYHYQSNVTKEGIDAVESVINELGPLHKVLHLYAILGNLNAYHDHYRDLRDEILYNITKKADKLANQSNNGLLIAIPKYFESIVGFFTIESILRKSVEVSDGVFSPIDITNLWEQIYKHINTLLQDLCITLVSPDELLYIKEEILLLIEVLSDEAYNLNIVPLYDIISNLYMIFQQLQMTNIIKLCSHTLDHCSYQPFYVTTQETFLEKIRAYRLEFIDIDDSNNSNHRHDDNSKLSRSQAIAARELVVANKEIAAANLDALEEELNNGLMNYDRGLAKSNSSGGWKDFNDENVSAKSGNGTSSKTSRDRRRSNSPMRLTKLQVQSFVAQTFPFSEAVTILMKQLHLFVVRFFIFAVRNNRLSSQADSVCGSLCQAITTISGMLIKELRNGGSDMPLSKVCQISIDAATISSASDTLWIITENALEQFHWIDETGITIDNNIAQSVAELRKVISSAQGLIFELLTEKINDLLGSLVFINFVPETIPNGPHECIEEIIDFLRVTFMWLTHLPQSIRDAIHFTCCSRVANGILEYLLSPTTFTKVNILCLLAFQYDIRKLILFSDSCGVTYLKQSFEELSEIINICFHVELPQFGDHVRTRQHLFPHVSPGKLASLLEKVVPSPAIANNYQLPKMEKNLLKNLIKKLRIEEKEN